MTDKKRSPGATSVVVIMLLHEGLTLIQSQIKPRLLFGESFTLTYLVPKMFLISPVYLKVPEILQFQVKDVAVFIFIFCLLIYL